VLCCNTINVIIENYAAVRNILMEARDISLLMEEARDILMEATDILVVEAKETYSWKQET